MEKLMEIIANIGFPIAVSIFLLIRVENKLDELSKCIHGLANVIKGIKQEIKN